MILQRKVIAVLNNELLGIVSIQFFLITFSKYLHVHCGKLESNIAVAFEKLIELPNT